MFLITRGLFSTSYPATRFALKPITRTLIGIGLTLPVLATQAQDDNQEKQNELKQLAPVSVKASSEKDTDKLITQERISRVGKLPVSVQDTPFAMAIVDAQKIQETGAKNIQEALTYSAGVYSGRYGFDTRGDWTAIRGLGTSSYIDGLRSIFGFYNNVRPEIFTLESVEVLKGPSSVLYGQSELGGIVNVVTKKPDDITAHDVELQFGSYERKQIAVDSTGPLTSDGTWLYRMVALRRDSDTQVDYVNDDARVFMPSVTWQPTADTSLTVLFSHQENDSVVSSQFLPSKGTVDPAPLGRIPSNRFAGEPGWDRYDTERDELSFIASHSITQSWKLAANLRKTDSASVTREIYTTVGVIPDDAGNTSRTLHTADRETDVTAGDVRLEGDFAFGPITHKLAMGVDYQNALWKEDNYTSFSSTDPNFNVYNPVYGNVNFAALQGNDSADNRIEQTGLYLMDHMEWGAWVLSLALRQDEARNVLLNVIPPNRVVRNTATTGRVGLMYRFNFGLSPYVSYSEAFAPNLGINRFTDTQLKPSTGEQQEIGFKYLSESGNTSAAFAWFDIEQTNRTVVGDNPEAVEQVGSTTDGWELEIRHRVEALELSANFTRLDAVNAATQTRLSSIAEETASTWAQYDFTDAWRAGLGIRYIGTVTGANNRPELPSVTLFDAMAGYTFDQWDFRLGIRNLSDKEYLSWCRGQNQDCGFGERRNAVLTATYAFE